MVGESVKWPPLTEVWPRELYQAVLSEGLHARTVRMAMADWQKSSLCSTNSCVGVLRLPEQGVVYVTQLSSPASPMQQFPETVWDEFLAAVKRGEFGPDPQ